MVTHSSNPLTDTSPFVTASEPTRHRASPATAAPLASGDGCTLSLTISLPPEALTLLASRVVERLEDQIAHLGTVPSPYLSASEAAAYLRCPKERIYKLSAAKAIPHFKEGNRLVFRRDEIDLWLQQQREGRDPRHTVAISSQTSRR